MIRVCRDDHWSSVYHRLRRCGTVEGLAVRGLCGASRTARGWLEIVGAFFERPRTVGGLAAARSTRGSDSPPDCHSLPLVSLRYARPYGSYPTSVQGCRGRCPHRPALSPCDHLIRLFACGENPPSPRGEGLVGLCVRCDGTGNPSPTDSIRPWCRVVGTTIGRPFIIAYGDAGRRGRRPLRGLSNFGAGP